MGTNLEPTPHQSQVQVLRKILRKLALNMRPGGCTLLTLDKSEYDQTGEVIDSRGDNGYDDEGEKR